MQHLGEGVTLVLGGARSGKSKFAEQLVLRSDLKPVYIATAQIWDDEMRARVDAHVARRGDKWRFIEATDDLETALQEADREANAILVDCLTLWLTNLMMAEANIEARCARLLDQLKSMQAPVVLVSSEVGMGIVPENKLARAFRDHAGVLHQDLADIANEVYLVAAGLPLQMKG